MQEIPFITKSELNTRIGEELNDHGQQLDPKDFNAYSRALDGLEKIPPPQNVTLRSEVWARVDKAIDDLAAKISARIVRYIFRLPPHG